MPAVSLFSLLATRLATTTSSGESPAAGSYGEWITLTSEFQSFLSALYAQPDSSPHLAEAEIIQHSSKHQQRASAATYASMVNLVEELGDEYIQRFGNASGAKLHLTIENGALVLYWSGNSEASPHPSAANAVKGLFLLKPEISKAFDGVPRHGDGYALVTDLERSYLCKVTRGDSLLVGDFPQATLFEALFFLIHLVFQGAAGAHEESNHKRKFGMISDDLPGEDRKSWGSRPHMDPFNRTYLMKTCRHLGFGFGLISDVVSLGLTGVQVTGERISDTGEYSVYRASFRGEKALFKEYRVEGFQDMVREVWVMRKLESLGIDVVPRLYAFGMVGPGFRIVMEDVSSSGGENDDPVKKKGYVEAARSSLRVLHLANVVHNRVSLESFVVGKGGRVFWINLEAAGVYDRDDDDPEEFLTLSREDNMQLRTLV